MAGDRAHIVTGGAVLDQHELPFQIDPHGAQLPQGKASFNLLTTGEYWVIAGGHDAEPLRPFAAIPSKQRGK